MWWNEPKLVEWLGREAALEGRVCGARLAHPRLGHPRLIPVSNASDANRSPARVERGKRLRLTLVQTSDLRVRAWEQAPAVEAVRSFATRVTGLATAQGQTVRSSWSGFGVRAAVASAVVRMGALFAFAPHAIRSFLNPRFDIEMLLAELGGAAYLAARLVRATRLESVLAGKHEFEAAAVDLPPAFASRRPA